ncbi:NADH dehydrogenase subunit F [Striga asiatica]|uniref:NADH dehydrogenase subunit F n=1 Tax=Striga asiatica TaxID=4170 RepID=A0A5A7R592_STRAF|nr:NADH dehydrogenase subunit F [Striga asiatica]
MGGLAFVLTLLKREFPGVHSSSYFEVSLLVWGYADSGCLSRGHGTFPCDLVFRAHGEGFRGNRRMLCLNNIKARAFFQCNTFFLYCLTLFAYPLFVKGIALCLRSGSIDSALWDIIGKNEARDESILVKG